MSSSSAESYRSWSIVARLALLYTVLSTVVLCAAGFFLYWTLIQSLRSEEQSTLADKIAVLRQILRERPEDRNALEEEIEWESAARRQSVYYARLILRGRTIVESPGFRSLLPSNDERIKPVTKSWKVVNCNPFSLPDFRPNQKVTILP